MRTHDRILPPAVELPNRMSLGTNAARFRLLPVAEYAERERAPLVDRKTGCRPHGLFRTAAVHFHLLHDSSRSMPNDDAGSSDADLSAAPDRSLSLETDEIFNVLSEAASRVLQRRFRVFLLVRQAYERMTAHSSLLTAVWQDLRTMMRLLLRWVDRSYRQVSWTPLLLIVGALLYFVTPIDLIPDALGAIGFVDDVTVITTVVQRLRGELDRFRAWEQRALPE